MMLLSAAGLLLAVVPVFGNRALIVRSGSMSPALGVGDLVIVREYGGEYREGQVIAFRGARSDVVVTHRVAEVRREGESVRYVTKGDANDAPDEGVVTADLVLGRKVVRVPYIGWLLSFGKTKLGFIAFIVVPALLVMAGDVVVIVREVRRRKIPPSPPLSRGEFRRAGIDAPLVKGGVGGISGRVGVLIPAPIMHTVPPRLYIDSLVGKALLLVFSVGMTIPSGLAFYTDTEASAGNSFTVAESFTADHVVISEVQVRGTSTLNDFIELYNPTGVDVDMSGWKLRKKSSTGTESSVIVLPEDSVIPAHGFFLWANSLEGYAASLEADASTTQTLAPDNSVVLKTDEDAAVDQVAWGNGGGTQFVERRPFALNPGQHQSIERKARQGSTAASLAVDGAEEFDGNGFDTDHNAFDFVLRGTSQPQNSTTGGTEEL